MSEDNGDDWSDYESGPFCRHWGDPWDCDNLCGGCGHTCSKHQDSACEVEGCACESWSDSTVDAQGEPQK